MYVYICIICFKVYMFILKSLMVLFIGTGLKQENDISD